MSSDESDQERSAVADLQPSVSVVKPIQEMFKKIIDMPYCTGTVQLNPAQSTLFYRSKDESKFIDFANPSETQLKALADACSPASFGKNKEDIVDENYRKAGKMDPVDFATQFSPWDSGVLRTAVETLFKTSDSTANLMVELYKLNVYGPGSFFKSHVDTPRSDAMFGSLVVVLPTHHTGGSLLFRHHDAEYTFDSAHTVSISPTDAPHAAFAAFFSDVEHEVAEVTSGYRVTLTYNLYHTTHTSSHKPSSVAIESEAQNMSTIRTALASLLSNPDFLPDGGLLAFGLAYEYPFDYTSTRLAQIEKRLKGIDALLRRVCEELDLHVSLKAVYQDPEDYYNQGEYAFTDGFVELPEEDTGEEFTLLEYICQNARGVVIGYDPLPGRRAPVYGKGAYLEIPEEERADIDYHIVPDTEVLPVVWAKPLDDKNAFKEKYIAYGNEATMGCAYGQVCLVARV